MLHGSDYGSKGLAYIIPFLKNNNSFFTLLDIGVSGGIDSFWNQFGDQLVGYGIDPLVSEIERLNKANTRNNIRYFDAWITAEDHEAKPLDQVASDIFSLSSANRTSMIMAEDYREKYFNDSMPLKFSDKKLSLDLFIKENQINAVDFIKIDTDGHDFFVLKGAKELLKSKQALGFQVECQFHGEPSESSNTFANIDNLLREHGYILFDIDVWKYSRAGLPKKFCYDIPAQTMSGQALWGEALYLLDPVIYSQTFDRLLTHKEKLLKLLGLYVAFGLTDCAATLALKMREKNIQFDNFSYSNFLNCLVPNNPFNISNYDSYIKKFENDPTSFYRTNWEQLENKKNYSPLVSKKIIHWLSRQYKKALLKLA